MEKMMRFLMYASDTGHFTDDEIEALDCSPELYSDMATVLAPEWILRKYYEEMFEESYRREYSFDEWFYEESTCDDFIELAEFIEKETGKPIELYPEDEAHLREIIKDIIIYEEE